MAQTRLPMRQFRELLHLHFEQGLSQRLIACNLGEVRSTMPHASFLRISNANKVLYQLAHRQEPTQ